MRQKGRRDQPAAGGAAQLPARGGEHVVVFRRVVEATSREEPRAPLLYHHGALVGP